MPLWTNPTLAIVIGYLLGAIPFGLILTRMAGAGDLREVGSGNIGATNVLRTGRKGIAAATLLLDIGKGAVAVLIARHLGEGLALLGGVGAFFGHLYPAWLKFRGGKGVATMLGICLALAWPIGLAFALVWIGALALTRISSVGGLAAAVAAPMASMVFGDPGMTIMLVALALMVIWKHRDNLKRLRAGTEPKVGQKPE